jgi:CRISPR-associated protein Cas6
MYWQENTEGKKFTVQDDVVDVSFTVTCRCLTVDHAYDLSQALRTVLPWFGDDDEAGVHPIHVADSGNGWMRPENPDDVLYLSRRTKLILRVPRPRVEATMGLSGNTLDVGGNSIEVGKGTVKPLSTITTIFSRYIVADDSADENGFLQKLSHRLDERGIKPKKMLCGMENVISTPERKVHTRSLMLADLSVEESVKLQQFGLGPMRHLGCGLFIPHKGINDLKQQTD